jgi:hypothetical protein
MLFPKYALEDLTIGSGSIIEKGNIEEFFNHVRASLAVPVNT